MTEWIVKVSVENNNGGGFTMQSIVREGNPAFLPAQLREEAAGLADTVIGSTLQAYGIETVDNRPAGWSLHDKECQRGQYLRRHRSSETAPICTCKRRAS